MWTAERSEAESGDPLAKVLGVIAANIWHWWIGVVLTVVGVLTVLGVIAGYLKNVTAKQYPGKRQHED